MTSISRAEHEKMQAALAGLQEDSALKMKEELAVMHEQFMAHLEAARQSVSSYEKQYKAARLLITKTVKEQKKSINGGLVNGMTQAHLLVLLLLAS